MNEYSENILSQFLNYKIPIKFWTYKKICFEIDYTSYITFEEVNNSKNLSHLIETKIKKYKFQQTRSFEKEKLHYLMKFFLLASGFNNLDISNEKYKSLAQGGVPSGLKIKCKCGKLLKRIANLRGNYFTEPDKSQPHEFYIRISDICPKCGKVICIYRDKQGIILPLLIFFNDLFPGKKYSLENEDVMIGWIIIIKNALDIHGEEAGKWFDKDIGKFYQIMKNSKIFADDIQDLKDNLKNGSLL